MDHQHIQPAGRRMAGAVLSCRLLGRRVCLVRWVGRVEILRMMNDGLYLVEGARRRDPVGGGTHVDFTASERVQRLRHTKLRELPDEGGAAGEHDRNGAECGHAQLLVSRLLHRADQRASREAQGHCGARRAYA